MSKIFTLVLGILVPLFSFSQTCNLINESFESPTTATSTTSFSSGWINNSSYVANDPTLARTGNQYAGMNATGDYVIAKAVDCPGEFRFYWRSSSGNGVFSVNIDWSENNGTTWNTARTISATGGGTTPTSYQLVTVDFAENTLFTTGKSILIRIYMTSRTSNSFYFDDVCVSQGVCRMNLGFQYDSPCIEVGQPSSFTVCAQDVSGTIDNTFTGNVTLSKQSGGGTVSGTLTKTAVAGCATFNDVSFSTAESYALRASDATPRSVDSKVFNVNTTCSISNISLKVMAYNLLNFPNSVSCSSNTVIPNRQDTLKKIVNYVLPDALMVCELQTLAGSNLILNNALNVGGVTHYAAANFVENTSSASKTYNNMFYYNSSKMTLVSQDIIPTTTRDISLYTVKMVDPNEVANGPTYLDFYVSHLKAGNTPEDAATRAADCQILADFIALRPASNAFFGGDFNFYSSTEEAYQNLTANPVNPFYDPLNRSGDWDGNTSFRDIHTQTTRATGINMDCGAQGGMDSRLDFIVTSNEVLTGTQRVTYRPGTYTALGNNGSVFNKSINDASNNSTVPKSVLNALFYMSDHLPIVMDVEVQLPLAAAALPLELLSFSAKFEEKGSISRLNWEIANALDVELFTVEHSSDGIRFQEIGEVKYQNDQNSYVFDHKNPENGTHFYRLKMSFWDGKTAYSHLVSIEVESGQFLVFPNPAKDRLYIQYHTRVATDAEIAIFNITGVEMYRGKVNLDEKQGFLVLNPEISALSPNTYILQLQTEFDVKQAIFIKN